MAAATVCSFVVFAIDAAAEKEGRRAGYGDGAASVRASSEATERLLAEDGDGGEEINLSAVFSFSSAFWLLAVSCISVYACVLPWNNVAQAFLLEKCPVRTLSIWLIMDAFIFTADTSTQRVNIDFILIIIFDFHHYCIFRYVHCIGQVPVPTARN